MKRPLGRRQVDGDQTVGQRAVADRGSFPPATTGADPETLQHIEHPVDADGSRRQPSMPAGYSGARMPGGEK